MDDHYWLSSGSEQRGPYTLSQLQSMWRAGSITAETLYFQHGSDEWVSISLLADILDSSHVPLTTSQAPRPTIKKEDSGSKSWIIVLLVGVAVVAGVYLLWQLSERPKRELAVALNSFFSEADELSAMTSIGTTRSDFSTKLSKVLPRYDSLASKLENQNFVPFDDYKDLSPAMFWWKATSEAWNSDNRAIREGNAPQNMSKASGFYQDAKRKLKKYTE